MATTKEESIASWSGRGTIESINAGSLQRIADATEKMVRSYDALREERDRNLRWYQEELGRRRKADRRVSALQGVITKMKNKSAKPVTA